MTCLSAICKAQFSNLYALQQCEGQPSERDKDCIYFEAQQCLYTLTSSYLTPQPMQNVSSVNIPCLWQCVNQEKHCPRRSMALAQMSCGAQSSKRWDDTTFDKKFSFTSSDCWFCLLAELARRLTCIFRVDIGLELESAKYVIVLNLKNARHPLLPAYLTIRKGINNPIMELICQRYVLKQKLGDYLGFFPKWQTPPTLTPTPSPLGNLIQKN